MLSNVQAVLASTTVKLGSTAKFRIAPFITLIA
jgi:hypothetical protein